MLYVHHGGSSSLNNTTAQEITCIAGIGAASPDTDLPSAANSLHGTAYGAPPSYDTT